LILKITSSDPSWNTLFVVPLYYCDEWNNFLRPVIIIYSIALLLLCFFSLHEEVLRSDIPKQIMEKEKIEINDLTILLNNEFLIIFFNSSNLGDAIRIYIQ